MAIALLHVTTVQVRNLFRYQHDSADSAIAAGIEDQPRIRQGNQTEKKANEKGGGMRSRQKGKEIAWLSTK